MTESDEFETFKLYIALGGGCNPGFPESTAALCLVVSTVTCLAKCSTMFTCAAEWMGCGMTIQCGRKSIKATATTAGLFTRLPGSGGHFPRPPPPPPSSATSQSSSLKSN